MSQEPLDNPYYITMPGPIKVMKAGERATEARKKEKKQRKVAVSAGDVCTAVLQNEEMCATFSHIKPLMEVGCAILDLVFECAY